MAVRPPAPLVARLRDLERPRRAGLGWTREEQWHVTVAFFASVEPADLVAALAAWSAAGGGISGGISGGTGDGIGGATGPAAGGAGGVLDAVAGPRPEALSSRVWALPVAGLGPLADSLFGALAGLRAAAEWRLGPAFSGHLTLARARRPADLEGLPGPVVKWAWAVAEVEAVRSELLRNGAHHETLGRWPLLPGLGAR